MPKQSVPSLINIDLLKPQGASQRLGYKAIKWLLSAGRYIIIFVEVIVLIAFLTRFKFDADIANTKDEITKLVPYVETLKPTEILIKKTQFQLATIKNMRESAPAFDEILIKVADQIPAGVVLTNLNLEQNDNKLVTVKISGSAKNNLELSTFISGLRTQKNFADVSIANIDLSEGTLNFSVVGGYNR